MALEVQDLSELDSAKVVQSQEFIAELVQEENPTVDAKRGVNHDLIFHFSGTLAAANQENIDRVRRANTVDALAGDDPNLADPDIVDGLLSNFLIDRQVGTQASGSVTIVVNKLATVTIPSGSTFEASGNLFQTDQSFVARISEANVQSGTDRVLTPLEGGNFSFTIEVTAVEAGSASLLKKDTLVTPQFSIVNFVKSQSQVGVGGTGLLSDGLRTKLSGYLLVDIPVGGGVPTLEIIDRRSSIFLADSGMWLPGLPGSPAIAAPAALAAVLESTAFAVSISAAVRGAELSAGRNPASDCSFPRVCRRRTYYRRYIDSLCIARYR